MDELDHALGRPDDPVLDTTRNFFGVGEDDACVDDMKNNPHWKLSRVFMGTAGFVVSTEGKVALHEYLHKNWTPPKRYDVTWMDSTQTIVAKTAGAAKYSLWLDCDFTDLPFGEFLKESKACVHHH
jgi:hypothetical protein